MVGVASIARDRTYSIYYQMQVGRTLLSARSFSRNEQVQLVVITLGKVRKRGSSCWAARRGRVTVSGIIEIQRREVVRCSIN